MFECQEISAEHKDLIHDVSFDYYGDRMVTCSSDQYVKVNLMFFGVIFTLNSVILWVKVGGLHVDLAGKAT